MQGETGKSRKNLDYLDSVGRGWGGSWMPVEIQEIRQVQVAGVWGYEILAVGIPEMQKIQ